MALNIEKIKRKMLEMNIGNKELSERSGVPLRTVNNILCGITKNPSIDNMIAIARILGSLVEDFVDTDNAIPYTPTTIAAHHEGEEWTETELDEIERFKDFVKAKREK